MTVYKLTDRNYRTFNDTQWGPGVTHSGTGEGPLCGPGWIHCYSDPLVALFLHQLHVNFYPVVVWEAEASGRFLDDGLKQGWETVTTLRVIDPPRPTMVQRVAFGILCSLEPPQSNEYRRWASDWLSGKNRSSAQARAAWAWAPPWSQAAAAVAQAAAMAAETKRLDLPALARKAMDDGPAGFGDGGGGG